MKENYKEMNPCDLVSECFELASERLTVRLINPEQNQEMLSRIPHRKVCEMEEVCCLTLKADETGKSFLTVTDRMLSEWGIGQMELFRIAEENAARKNPASLRPLLSVLNGMIGGEEPEPEEDSEEPCPNQLYLATNRDGVLGAGVIMYPGFLAEAARQLGSSFYLLPSSIHEFLFLPNKGPYDVEELNHMVQAINESEVSPRERLADRVLYYDAQSEELYVPGTALSFDFRQQCGCY